MTFDPKCSNHRFQKNIFCGPDVSKPNPKCWGFESVAEFSRLPKIHLVIRFGIHMTACLQLTFDWHSDEFHVAKCLHRDQETHDCDRETRNNWPSRSNRDKNTSQPSSTNSPTGLQTSISGGVPIQLEAEANPCIDQNVSAYSEIADSTLEFSRGTASVLKSSASNKSASILPNGRQQSRRSGKTQPIGDLMLAVLARYGIDPSEFLVDSSQLSRAS